MQLMDMIHRGMRALSGGERPGVGSDFWYGSYERPTASGVVVTPESVLTGQSALVFTCVRILAEAIGVVPLMVYRRKGDDSRDPAATHPVYRLLHERPNGWMTPSTFKQLIEICITLRGNFYALIRYDQNGNPESLIPLHPAGVRVKLLDNLTVRYEVYDSKLKQWRFVPQDYILHIPSSMLSADGVTGLSVLSAGRNSVANSVAAEDHGGRTFKNSAVPSLVITHPEQLTDKARTGLRDEWISTHGAEKQGGVAVLDEGVTIEKIGMSNEDAQLIETRKFSREEIAALFRVPLFLVNAMENGASYASIEQVNRAFVTYSLLPTLKMIEESVKRALIVDDENNSYYCEFKLDIYLRADLQKRTAAYSQSWWLTPNEIRQLENLPRIEAPGMDDVQIPLNRGAPGGSATTPNNSNNSPDKSALKAEEFKPLFAEAAGRVVRRELRELQKAATAHKDKPKFLAAAKRMYEDHVPYIEATMETLTLVFEASCSKKLHVKRVANETCEAAYLALEMSDAPWDVLAGWVEADMQAALVQKLMEGE